MSDEPDEVKIARIDENVKLLLKTLPVISDLEKESAINKEQHRTAFWLISLLAAPSLLWICKKLGLPIF